MAKCDQGYLCQVCGSAVVGLTDSALYLQYVIGWIDPERLHAQRECHLRCNPSLAQFIDDQRFSPPVIIEGTFDRRQLDPEFARQRAELINRGYQRLWELQKNRRELNVADYPLTEAIARWQ